ALGHLVERRAAFEVDIRRDLEQLAAGFSFGGCVRAGVSAAVSAGAAGEDEGSCSCGCEKRQSLLHDLPFSVRSRPAGSSVCWCRYQWESNLDRKSFARSLFGAEKNSSGVASSTISPSAMNTTRS